MKNSQAIVGRILDELIFKSIEVSKATDWLKWLDSDELTEFSASLLNTDSRRKMAALTSFLISLLVVLFLYSCDNSVISPNDTTNGTEVSANITTETIWDSIHSPYIIKDNITIEKKAVLRIQPGTQVRFDGFYELVVKGILLADGMANQSLNLITVTSNKPASEIGDWKGIKFDNTNDDKSLISAVEIMYAQSAISIFSSSPEIRDCIIKNNNDGICWVDSHSNIHYNLISNNINGVVGKRVPANLRKNIITQNEVGILIFSRLAEMPRIQENNLYKNLTYALRIKTVRDIDAKYNWWGTSDVGGIEELIWDRRDDKNLGRVTFSPFHTSEVAQAGPSYLE